MPPAFLVSQSCRTSKLLAIPIPLLAPTRHKLIGMSCASVLTGIQTRKMLFKRKNQTLFLSPLFAAVQFIPPLNVAAQAPAQAPVAAPAAAGSGPIDIQAHEQEFTGDHVIAKGNVKVLYKD